MTTENPGDFFNQELKKQGVELPKPSKWRELDAEDSRLARHMDPVAMKKGNSDISKLKRLS